MKKILILIIFLIGGINVIGNTYAANTTNATLSSLDTLLNSSTSTTPASTTPASTTSTNSGIFNKTDDGVWNKAKVVLGNIANSFYFAFYENSLNDFFGNIPGIGPKIVGNGLIWWVAFIMSIITLLAYLFVDKSSNSTINKYLGGFGAGNQGGGGMGMDGMGMQDPMMGGDGMGMDGMGMDGMGMNGMGMNGMGMQDPMMGGDGMGMDGMGGSMGGQGEKDLWHLIQTNFLLAMNDKVKSSDKMMIWGFIIYIIVSLLLIATFVNTAFLSLLQDAKGTISYLIYNVIVIMLGIGLIFLAKVIYIDGLVGAYMNQKSEPSLKPAIMTLFAYAIIVIVVYSALYALQNALFT